ncbi:MAG: adenosylcobinamide-GDP ribazoletransferase [Rhodospirillales bacterium]|nr:adenosylcobinamide-GDP ribazoletransferase [Rhodospirillales bacterium]
MPDPDPNPGTQPRPALVGWLAEIRIATAFLTRFGIHLKPEEAERPLASAIRAFPLVGVGVGLAGGIAYALADFAGMASSVSALLAIAAMALVTGGLHEDGLADTADGLGGGADPEARLAIMRDSRIGTFGVLALIFSISLRVSALSYAGWTGEAVLAIVAAAAGSRACLPAVMYLVPPARRDGLSWAAGAPDQRRVVDAGLLGVIIVVLCIGAIGGVVAILAAAIVTALIASHAHHRLGGQTGDVIGAVQQGAEIAILLAFLGTPTW